MTVPLTDVVPAGSVQFGTVCPAGLTTTVSGGGGGGINDYLGGVLIIPATTSPGAVTVSDGGGTSRTIFTGGASSVLDLKPIPVPIGAFSQTGAWSITCGSSVSVQPLGKFT